MESMCAICQTLISSTQETKICAKCKCNFHIECWNEYGGCATYGCSNAPAMTKGPNEQSLEHTFWGAKTKICPMCGEAIKMSELICPYCNEHFDTIEPITAEEIRGRFTKHLAEDKRMGAVIIFICGLLGITAPFNLIFGGIWYKKNRLKLRETSPLHNLLAGIGLSTSIFYSLLILFGIFSH